MITRGLILLILFFSLEGYAEENSAKEETSIKKESNKLPPLPAPTGLKVYLIEKEEDPKEKNQMKINKEYWEISWQGMTNFYFGRPELATAKNKLTSSGRYVWSEVIKVQKTWEDTEKGNYLMTRILVGNTNFGGQTYGVFTGFGWSGKYYQLGPFIGLQHRGEQYYLNDFKFNPRNPPPPPPPGTKTKFSFTSPLPENPLFGFELNFRVPVSNKINLKLNNQILPGVTHHGLGVEWNY